MCWVIPPASVSTTALWRIASSSVVVLFGLEVLFRRVLDVHLAVDLGCDQPDRLVGEGLGDGDHLPEAHHDLDDLGDRDPERRGKLLDRRPGRNVDRTGRLNYFLRRCLRPRLLPVAGLPRVLAWPGGLLVDDDAAPPAAADRALAGANGAIRSVRAGISHLRPSQCKSERAPDRPAPTGAAYG